VLPTKQTHTGFVQNSQTRARLTVQSVATTVSMMGVGISPSYKRPVIEAVVLSLVLIVLSGMVLDTGEVFFASMYGLAGSWVGTLMIILRRPQAPTRTDLQLIRYGPLLFIVVSQVLSPPIWDLRGVPM